MDIALLSDTVSLATSPTVGLAKFILRQPYILSSAILPMAALALPPVKSSPRRTASRTLIRRSGDRSAEAMIPRKTEEATGFSAVLVMMDCLVEVVMVGGGGTLMDLEGKIGMNHCGGRQMILRLILFMR